MAQQKDFTFEYMLLGRLQADCEAYISNGARRLWEGNPKDQIAKMYELYDMLPVKPEWITIQDINRYTYRMNVSEK